MKITPILPPRPEADEVMERGAKTDSLQHGIALERHARTVRDVHDPIDRRRLWLRRERAKQVSCRATSSLSFRNELGRMFVTASPTQKSTARMPSAISRGHYLLARPILRPPLRRVTVARDELVFTISSVSEGPPSRSALQFSPNRRANQVLIRWVRAA
jgi:hypothetical protein